MKIILIIATTIVALFLLMTGCSIIPKSDPLTDHKVESSNFYRGTINGYLWIIQPRRTTCVAEIYAKGTVFRVEEKKIAEKTFGCGSMVVICVWTSRNKRNWQKQKILN